MKNYSLFVECRKVADKISRAFKLCGIRYERSGCGEGYYFSIACKPENVGHINALLDRVYAGED